jgi:hypothetical protein
MYRVMEGVPYSAFSERDNKMIYFAYFRQLQCGVRCSIENKTVFLGSASLFYGMPLLLFDFINWSGHDLPCKLGYD